jgi:hypothetical protein
VFLLPDRPSSFFEIVSFDVAADMHAAFGEGARSAAAHCFAQSV